MSELSKKAEKKVSGIQCVVVSDKMKKSRVGLVERRVKAPRLSKYILRSTRVMFHDENNTSKLGDTVLIMPSKSMSSKKKFCLSKVVKTAMTEGL